MDQAAQRCFCLARLPGKKTMPTHRRYPEPRHAPMTDWPDVFERLRAFAQGYGVEVRTRPMEPETTGIFDGLSITCNSAYDLETCCYNVAHSFGHIVQWSVEYPRQRALYEELYRAKASREVDPASLGAALDHFRAYEEEASEYAVWLLEAAGCAAVVPSFTTF